MNSRNAILLLMVPAALILQGCGGSSSNRLSKVSSNEVQLSWIAGTGQPAGYHIERSTDGVNYSTVLDVAPTATSATVMGLASGTTYYFRVQAYNGAGTSDSQVIQVKVPAP